MFNMSNNWISSALLTLTAVILYYVFRLIKRYDYWKNLGISGPKPYPIFGNLLSLRKRVHTTKLEWTKKYGKLYGIYYGLKPMLVVADPQVIKRIMVKDFDSFRNKHKQIILDPLLSLSLPDLSDDKWKRARAIITPTFTSGKLKAMYASITDSVNQFLGVLDVRATTGEVTDFLYMTQNLTLNVMLKSAFGLTINTYENSENLFLKYMRNLTSFSFLKIIFLSIMPRFIQKLLNIRGMLPSKNIDYIVDVMKSIIKERKTSGKDYKDLLQLLINAEYTEAELKAIDGNDKSVANYNNEGNDEKEAITKELKNFKGSAKLTEIEVIAEAVVFYLAGFETTAATLTHCCFELAVNQDIQQRMYEEIKSAVDSNGNISYDVLMQLPYLDAVICETLRKYPLVITMRRECGYEYKLDEYNTTIPKHQAIEIATYCVHHNEEYFPNPELFIPDRFLPENRHKIVPYSYMPFGLGPRNCVGMRFALMEAKLCIALMINKYKLVNINNIERITFKYSSFGLIANNVSLQIQKR